MNSVLDGNVVFATYTVYQRPTLPGEVVSPLLTKQQIKPVAFEQRFGLDARLQRCPLECNPKYIVQWSHLPPPEGYTYRWGAPPIPPEVDQQVVHVPLPSPEEKKTTVDISLLNAFGEGRAKGATSLSASGMRNGSQPTFSYNAIGAREPSSIKEVSTPVESGATVLNRDDDVVSHQRFDTPYEITQILIAHVVIKILGEAIYSYTGTHYAHITAENLRRLIMYHCRPAVEKEGTARLIEEIYRLLLCEPRICQLEEDIDENLVSFRNGVLDLRKKRLYPHDPKFNTYYLIDADFTPTSAHPAFDRFLYSITGGDPVLQSRFFEIIGLCLVPDMRAKSFFVFQGVPDSGKSALASFIRGCFSKENTVAQDILVLGDRFAASTLIGKQLCVSMDLPSSPLNDKAVSVFKMLTGGDPITADVKYRPAITFLNRAKFILGTNHPVLTQSPDPAFFRRLVTVPFAYTVPKDAQDFHLQEKLRAERSAIVYDAIQAYWRLRENRYVFSGNYPLNTVVAYGAPIKQLSLDDIVEDFLRNSCQIQEGAGTFIRDLHAAFDAQHPGLLAINTFSEKLLAVCEALDLPVKRGGRKRPKGEGKLIANVIGLTLK